jgi:hypothetical protein
MMRAVSVFSARFSGERSSVVEGGAPAGVEVDGSGGTVRIEWDQDAAMTPLGQLPFFIDFLKTSGLFDAFVSDCPLRYQRPQRAQQGRCVGRDDAVDAGWAQTLGPHRRLAMRRCSAGAPGDGEDRQ